MTASLFAYAFFGAALTLSPLGLGLKLLVILAGSLLVAAAIRWSVGASAIVRHKAEIDGFNILILFVFVAVAQKPKRAPVDAALGGGVDQRFLAPVDRLAELLERRPASPARSGR